jgi:hypothetical protein
MKTRLILKPGQPGTKRLVEKYGEPCCASVSSMIVNRGSAVELIVERTAWTPPPSRYAVDTLVPLRIEVADMPLRLQAKAAGGRWNPEKKLWFVKYGNISGTPLEKHIHVMVS